MQSLTLSAQPYGGCFQTGDHVGDRNCLILSARSKMITLKMLKFKMKCDAAYSEMFFMPTYRLMVEFFSGEVPC